MSEMVDRDLSTPQKIAALQTWLGPDIEIRRIELLGGGSIQQNWLLEGVANQQAFAWVLRTNAASSLERSHSRAQEFALLRVAESAGVTVPKPRVLCEDVAVIGAPFFVCDRAPGVARASRVVRDFSLGGDRSKIGEMLGVELARIHSIRPPVAELDFLTPPARSAALDMIELERATLDSFDISRPVLEWGLRWLERNAATPAEVVLCHRDFRTGNYMLDEHGLSAILDWEFAGWSERAEDLGWFCASCWRFGRDDLEAGGVASRADFYRGYERESGVRVDDDAVRYWEVAAHVRWAIIALLQADRHIRGAETSLELALTSHLVPELESNVLSLTGISR